MKNRLLNVIGCYMDLVNMFHPSRMPENGLRQSRQLQRAIPIGADGNLLRTLFDSCHVLRDAASMSCYVLFHVGFITCLWPFFLTENQVSIGSDLRKSARHLSFEWRKHCISRLLEAQNAQNIHITGRLKVESALLYAKKDGAHSAAWIKASGYRRNTSMLEAA